LDRCTGEASVREIATPGIDLAPGLFQTRDVHERADPCDTDQRTGCVKRFAFDGVARRQRCRTLRASMRQAPEKSGAVAMQRISLHAGGGSRVVASDTGVPPDAFVLAFVLACITHASDRP